MRANNQLEGIVTSRDMRFETQLDKPVSSVMTKKADLVTVKEGAAREEILGLMHEHRIEKILLVDDASVSYTHLTLPTKRIV